MNRLKPILPAPVRPGDHDGQDLGFMSSHEQPPSKKRAVVSIACNTCRVKKSACDGGRPACARCVKRSLPCSYVEEITKKALTHRVDLLQQELAEYKDFFKRVRTMPEDEAIQAVRRMKALKPTSPHDTAGELNMMRLSEVQASQGVLPPMRSHVESELQVLRPLAYPPLEPLQPESIDIVSWFRPMAQSSAYTQSSQHLSTAGNSYKQNVTSPVSSPLQEKTHAGAASETDSSREGPLCDARLKLLKMDYWSKIPIDDGFASNVMSHFFTAHFPIFACFDADSFLDDLVQRKGNYCSAFLVSSVMSIACQSFSTSDVRSSALSAAFEKEAEVLWHAERSNDDPITLAAMCYLAMAAGMSGREELGALLLGDIRAMAPRMNLFGSRPSNQVLKSHHQLLPEQLKAIAAAAWGAYGWLTFHAVHYPADPIEFPPFLPIPGDADRKRGGLVWAPHPLPDFVGQATTSLCKLWPVIQELDHVYSLMGQIPLAQRVTLAFAESRYRKLLVWADALKLKMPPGKSIAFHVFFFHSIYHITIVRLFQPFLDNPDHTRLYSSNSKDSDPATIYAASMQRLKHLLIWYWMKPRSQTDHDWPNAAVLQGFTVVLGNTNDPDWRVYFQLCFSFWKEAYVRYRVYLQAVKASLTFALDQGVINSRVAVTMLNEARAAGLYHEAPEHAFLTAIAEYEMAAKGRKDVKVDVMAKEFTDMVVAEPMSDVEYDDDSAFSHSSEPGSSHNWLRTVLGDS